jgi:hypothetical protein
LTKILTTRFLDRFDVDHPADESALEPIIWALLNALKSSGALLIEHESSAPYSFDERRFAGAIDLAAQIADLDIDQVHF